MSKATIYINGVIGQDTTLLDVIRQFKAFKKPTEVEVHIDSVGGNVDEGTSIFSYLRNLNLPITTKATKAYSIAAQIFMAGDVREVEEGEERIMIHMPWATLQGNSETFETAAKQLKEIENQFVDFYAIYTEVDKDSIRKILENETFLSAEQAKEMGLATTVTTPLKAVAYYINDEKEQKEMTKTEKLIQAFATFLGVNEVEAKALVLQDANGNEVNFPELAENEQPEVGSKVEAEDGEILMPDGIRYIIEGGEVKEIIQPEEEAPVEEEAEVEAQAEVEEDELLKMLAALEERIMKKVNELLLPQEEVRALLKEAKNNITEQMQAQINALKKEIGSEIDNTPTNNQNKAQSNGNSLTNVFKNYKKTK